MRSRLTSLALAFWLPVSAARADENAAAQRGNEGPRPTIRTYLRVTVVDDPSKAPPLPTSRPGRTEAGQRPVLPSSEDRLLRPGEQPEAVRPRPEARPAEQARPSEENLRGQEPPLIREVLRREEGRELRQLRQELREARQERREAMPNRDAAEQKRPLLRERFSDRLRDGDRRPRDIKP
ncbi:MAG: hypothetical protein RMK29_00270 [Myxococcales bacterium]|nr:hypothetical protein [Myxococcota bacterium]MDW8280110.1 hypothetical protein [Myxococcales bacterium]